MKISWKIVMITTYAFLFSACVYLLYTNLDKSVSLSYMQDGYGDTQEDLETIVALFNHTDLSYAEVAQYIADSTAFEIYNKPPGAINLNRFDFIYDGEQLMEIVKRR